MRTPLPAWVYEALRALPSRELEELAVKTGVSARHLWRIRSGRTRFVRDHTLSQLRRHLRPTSDAQSVREIAQQIHTDKDLDRLFDLLVDTPRTAINIHKILVERGWGALEFKNRLCELAAAWQGKQYRFQVRDPAALQRFLEIFDRVKGRRVRKEMRKVSALIRQKIGRLATTEGVREVLLGEDRLTLEELCLIADALEVDPSELFVATPEGRKVLRGVLILTSRSRKLEDQQVNRLLNRVRRLLGIEF